MKNPILVFLFSIDHKSMWLNKLFVKLRLYEIIYPYPFEYFCVFCARDVCNDWFNSKEYYLNDMRWDRKVNAFIF